MACPEGAVRSRGPSEILAHSVFVGVGRTGSGIRGEAPTGRAPMGPSSGTDGEGPTPQRNSPDAALRRPQGPQVFSMDDLDQTVSLADWYEKGSARGTSAPSGNVAPEGREDLPGELRAALATLARWNRTESGRAATHENVVAGRVIEQPLANRGDLPPDSLEQRTSYPLGSQASEQKAKEGS